MNKELIERVSNLLGETPQIVTAEIIISLCADEAIDAVNFAFKLPEMAAITVENARIHDLYRTLAIDAIEKRMKCKELTSNENL